HTVVIRWGDGSADTTLTLPATVVSFTTSHRYLDNRAGDEAFAVAVTVTDQDGASASGGTAVIVANVAPANVALSAAPATIDEDGTTTLSGSFTDPGTLDTHTVVISWGDGSADTALSLAAGVLGFSASHRYLDNRPGDAPFALAVTVTDKDGASASA